LLGSVSRKPPLVLQLMDDRARISFRPRSVHRRWGVVRPTRNKLGHLNFCLPNRPVVQAPFRRFFSRDESSPTQPTNRPACLPIVLRDLPALARCLRHVVRWVDSHVQQESDNRQNPLARSADGWPLVEKPCCAPGRPVRVLMIAGPAPKTRVSLVRDPRPNCNFARQTTRNTDALRGFHIRPPYRSELSWFSGKPRALCVPGDGCRCSPLNAKRWGLVRFRVCAGRRLMAKRPRTPRVNNVPPRLR